MQKFKKLTFLAIITMAMLTGCDLKDKVNNALTFTFSQETSFTIPSSSVVNLPIDIQTPDIPSSGNKAFENNNTSASLVEVVTLSKLDLTITSPSTRTFSFLKSIAIYISTNDSNETLLAEKQNVDANTGSTLVLETSGENLKPYLTADSYNLRYEVVTKETTNSATDITADMEFTVNARVL